MPLLMLIASSLGRKTHHEPLTASPSLDVLSEDMAGGLSIQ